MQTQSREHVMAIGQVRQVLSHLRKALTTCQETGATDGELLERFYVSRDEAAFELLVWRHHRMVLGVCSRILADANDVEDAFQATFLILARKGRSIRKRGSLSSWLFGVARRVALEASRKTQRLQPSGLTLPPSCPQRSRRLDRGSHQRIRRALRRRVCAQPRRERSACNRQTSACQPRS